MNKRGKTAINSIIAFCLAAGTQVFFVLCLSFLRAGWQPWLYTLALTVGTVVIIGIFCLEVLCFYFGKEWLYKSAITAYVLLLFVFTVLYILLKTGFLDIVRDEATLEAYLENAGSWMGVLFVALQYLQVVILPIPSFVTVAAGTALFGPLRCAIFSLVGILLGSFTAFLIGRYVGYKAVAWMIGKDTLDKWLKKVKGKDKLLLSAMFLLPVFPDDVLCFVAGLSSMSLAFFSCVILLSRVIAIFTTCYSVTLIPFDTWWGIALWIFFFVAVAVLFVVLYKKSDAIEGWFYQKFHRETRVKMNEQKKKESDFSVEIVDPNGAIVEKQISGEENDHNTLK